MRATEALKLQAQDPEHVTERTLRAQQDAINILTTVDPEKATDKVVDWPNEEPQPPEIQDRGKHKVVMSTGTNGQIVQLGTEFDAYHDSLEEIKAQISALTVQKMQLEIEFRKAIGRNLGGTLASERATYTNELVTSPARFTQGSSGKRLRKGKPRPVTR